MHPVVIMAYDKSPAINKAVEALEEAGLEVRVLNTARAKLAEFLGALAGDDEELDELPPEEPKAEEPKEEEPPVEEEPKDSEPKKKEAEEESAEEEVKLESVIGYVDGEEIVIEIVEGQSELVPSGLMVGTKTAYMVNESHFAFWPASTDGMFDLTHDVQVSIGDKAVYEAVKILPAADKAVLKLNKATYEKFVATQSE